MTATLVSPLTGPVPFLWHCLQVDVSTTALQPSQALLLAWVDHLMDEEVPVDRYVDDKLTISNYQNIIQLGSMAHQQQQQQQHHQQGAETIRRPIRH